MIWPYTLLTGNPKIDRYCILIKLFDYVYAKEHKKEDAQMKMKYIVIYVNSRICQLWKELNAFKDKDTKLKMHISMLPCFHSNWRIMNSTTPVLFDS